MGIIKWKYETIPATTPDIKKIIIFLHGVGSDLENMKDLAKLFLNKFSNFEMICVNAPNSFEGASFGYQWFSITDKSLPEIQKQIKLGYANFSSFLSEIIKKYNVKYSDLILVGFSQGGMMAFNTICNINLGAIVGFSACAILPIDFSRHKITTPVCFIHGKEDDIIPLELLKNSLSMVASYSDYDLLLIDNLKHAIDLQGIRHAIDFIDRIVNKDNISFSTPE